MVYVVPFYLFRATRPSPTLERNHPSNIRARFRIVAAACAISALVTVYVVQRHGNATIAEAVRLLGWWPIALVDIVRPLLLTVVLFAGPLFEKGFVRGKWRYWARARGFPNATISVYDLRDYVVVGILSSFCISNIY